MKIEANNGNNAEPLSLGVLAIGDVFRFSFTPFADAVSDGLFYMVIDSKVIGTNEGVAIVSMDGKSVMRRDREHKVFRHKTTLQIEPK